jgi:hypothetical protein
MRSSATSDFVSDYAAKRAAQLERARALKEQRAETQQAPNSNGPSQLPAKSSANGFVYPPAGAGVPSNVNPNTLGTMAYPPPLGGGGVGQVASMLSNHVTANASTSVMMVTEADFRKASKVGIITPDQARQLWAVLSNQATPSSSNLPPGMMEMTERPTAAGVRPTTQQQQHQPDVYVPQQYAVPGGGRSNGVDYALQDDEAIPSSRGGGGTAGGNSNNTKAQQTAQRKSSKPEWSSDFASCYPTDDTSAIDSGYGAPPPPRTTSITAAAKAKQQQQQQQQSRPQWNSGDDSPSSVRDTPIEGNRRTPPVGAGPFGRVKDQPAGGLEEFMPAKQPAPKSSKAPPQPSLDDRPARPAGGAGVKQPQPTAAPAASSKGSAGTAATQRGGIALRQGGSRPAGGGRQQQQQEELTEAPQQSPEEIAEFLAMKEQQRRAFEDALNEASQREPLVPCGLCGRTFRESVIDRHEGACRIANKKRKAYDVKGHRLEGIEGIEDVPHYPDPPPPARSVASRQAQGQQQQQQPKMAKWKLQHLQFQAFLKQGTGQVVEAPPDDRVACPHCNRKFAEETAARHIPKCANTMAKPKSLARPGRK